MPVIYVDVVWLVNFVMDSFILIITAKMLQRPLRTRRVLAGAALGATLSFMLFLPTLSMIFMLLLKLLSSVALVWFVYRPSHIGHLLRVLGVFYVASFVTGGAAYGLTSLLGAQMDVATGLMYTGGSVLWKTQATLLTFFAIPLVYLLGRNVWSRIHRLQARQHHLCQMVIRIGQESFSCQGLIDTGNSLTDPLSGQPVAVLDWKVLEPIIPIEIGAVYALGNDPLTQADVLSTHSTWISRCRIVPYKGVGGSMGMLLAIKPDEVRIRVGEEESTCRPMWLALQARPLSSDGAYRAIIPPASVEGEVITESARVS